MKKIIFFFSLILLTSCGGGGSSDENNNNQNQVSAGGQSGIVGVWRYTDTHPDDEWYVHVDENGVLSDYDYLGDAFDNLANCYDIYLGWGTLTYESNDTYVFNDELGNPGIELQITKNDSGQLVISDGEQTGAWDPTSLTVSDLVPNCDDIVLKENNPLNFIVPKATGLFER